MHILPIPASGVNASGENTAIVPAFANDLSYIARLVYGKLFRLAHGQGFDGVAQYRVSRLAEMLPYSKSAIEKALVELRLAGWVTTWTNGRKSFCIPIVNLQPKELSWIEDHRHCAVVPADSPASFTVPVRIRNVPGTVSSIRKNKTNPSKKKEQDIKTEAAPVAEPVVDVVVSATLEAERETVNETCAVEPSTIPADPESKGEDSIAAQLETRLRSEGIRADIAAALMEHGAVRVSRNLLYVERATQGRETDGKCAVKNRAGYIRTAIEQDYAKDLDLKQVGVKAKPEGSRRIESVRAPRPDKSTMYHQFTEAELNGEDVPVNMPPKPLCASVGVPEQDLDKLPAALAERLRRRRERVK